MICNPFARFDERLWLTYRYFNGYLGFSLRVQIVPKFRQLPAVAVTCGGASALDVVRWVADIMPPLSVMDMGVITAITAAMYGSLRDSWDMNSLLSKN